MPMSRPKAPSVATVSSFAPARIAPACSGHSNEYTAVLRRSIVRMSSTRGHIGHEREVHVDQLAGRAREQRVVHDLDQAAAHDVADSAAVDEPVGVEEGEVAGDHGRADPAVLGRGIRGARRERAIAVGAGEVRGAAPREVAVDDVVVHDERGVQQLERRPDAGRRLGVGAAERVVGGEHHARPEPLAADRVRLELLPELAGTRRPGGSHASWLG